MEVLVIGATGKTGRQVTDALRARGATVRAASRSAAADATAKDGVLPVRFDWADRTTWKPALGAAQGLFIVGPTSDPDGAQTVRALLATAADVEHIVLLSVLGVDRLPAALPMLQWEKDVQASGKRWTVLRPNWFQQNLGDGAYTPGLRDRGVLELATGDGALSLVDTRDIADVAAAAFTEDGHDGQTYVLTGPEAHSYAEAVKIISAASGRDLAFTALDPEVAAERMRAAGAPERSMVWQAGLAQLIRDGFNATVTDTVQRITGHPARSFTAYAAERAEAWRLD